jgi:hypothetical protein
MSGGAAGIFSHMGHVYASWSSWGACEYKWLTTDAAAEAPMPCTSHSAPLRQKPQDRSDRVAVAEDAPEDWVRRWFMLAKGDAHKERQPTRRQSTTHTSTRRRSSSSNRMREEQRQHQQRRPIGAQSSETQCATKARVHHSHAGPSRTTFNVQLLTAYSGPREPQGAGQSPGPGPPQPPPGPTRSRRPKPPGTAPETPCLLWDR